MATGAPKEPASACDATWSNVDIDGNVCDTYALSMSANGSSVLNVLKSIGVCTASSAEAEGLGLLKLTDLSIYGRMVWARLGRALGGPTVLLCDAEAALRTASGQTSAARLRHALRRSVLVTQRVRDEEVSLVHLADTCQFVDFFTKWVDEKKFEKSVGYLVGATAYAAFFGGDATGAALAMVAALDAAGLIADPTGDSEA